MAYQKTIDVNILSYSDVCEAYDAMKDALEKLQGSQSKEFLNLLGDKVVDALSSYYPASQVEVEKTEPNGNNGAYSMTVSAKGDQLLFIEFGTGFPADETMGLSFGFGAGSWSEEHEKTFSQWLTSGANPDEYPYNMPGKDAFWKVEQDLRAIVKETASEVFG